LPSGTILSNWDLPLSLKSGDDQVGDSYLANLVAVALDRGFDPCDLVGLGSLLVADVIDLEELPDLKTDDCGHEDADPQHPPAVSVSAYL
jgi:hypothetical protein